MERGERLEAHVRKDQPIDVVGAVEDVGTRAGAEDVITWAALDVVAAWRSGGVETTEPGLVAAQLVVPGAALDDVISLVAVELVVAVTADEAIVALAAEDEEAD